MLKPGEAFVEALAEAESGRGKASTTGKDLDGGTLSCNYSGQDVSEEQLYEAYVFAFEELLCLLPERLCVW